MTPSRFRRQPCNIRGHTLAGEQARKTHRRFLRVSCNKVVRVWACLTSWVLFWFRGLLVSCFSLFLHVADQQYSSQKKEQWKILSGDRRLSVMFAPAHPRLCTRTWMAHIPRDEWARKEAAKCSCWSLRCKGGLKPEIRGRTLLLLSS